jgi:hypothetical protein
MDPHEKRLVIGWGLLAALTLLSLEGAPALGSTALFAAVVMIIAFVKVRIVVREFMEVRRAPLALRLVLDIWGVAVCGTLVLQLAWPEFIIGT